MPRWQNLVNAPDWKPFSFQDRKKALAEKLNIEKSANPRYLVPSGLMGSNPILGAFSFSVPVRK